MCGIIGGNIKNANLILNKKQIKYALDSLFHRGPDEEGLFIEKNTFLGIRRLSIIDLNTGSQPIFNEDNNLIIVCNGEIYNYIELYNKLKYNHKFSTHSDIEVLIHLYEEKHQNIQEIFNQIRGMFAFCIYDKKEKIFFIARDFFGKKPLYYYYTPNFGILFASELKALVKLCKIFKIQLNIRTQSIYDYLSLYIIPQPYTIYENIYSLSPGSYLIYDIDNTTILQKIYWELKFTPKIYDLSYKEILKKTQDLISEAVKIRLRSDVPLGIFLSGGIDSTIITYEALKYKKDIKTFTIAVDDKNLDESTLAQKTSKLWGFDNIILNLKINPQEELLKIIEFYDQPYGDSSAIPTLAISKLARQYIKVVLNGDGGDEIFYGYRRYLAAYIFAHFPSLFEYFSKIIYKILPKNIKFIKRRSKLGFFIRFIRGATLSFEKRYLIWLLDMFIDEEKRKIFKSNLNFSPTEEIINNIIPKYKLNLLEKQVYCDIYINLVSDLLVKMDIGTMAYSLEARSPLLDNKLAEFIARIPINFKLHRYKLKSLLKQAYKDILPSHIIKQPKRGFEVPLRKWLKNELKEILSDNLFSSNAKIYNYLERNIIKDIIEEKIYNFHKWETIVYSLLILELWLKRNNY